MRLLAGPVLVCVALLTGCSSTVRVSSDPPGALVLLPDGREAVTPFELKARRSPIPSRAADRNTGPVMLVQAPGHRALEVRVGRNIQDGRYELVAVDPRRSLRNEVRLQLVKEHGPSGTWRETDLP